MGTLHCLFRERDVQCTLSQQADEMHLFLNSWRIDLAQFLQISILRKSIRAMLDGENYFWEVDIEFEIF